MTFFFTFFIPQEGGSGSFPPPPLDTHLGGSGVQGVYAHFTPSPPNKYEELHNLDFSTSLIFFRFLSGNFHFLFFLSFTTYSFFLLFSLFLSFSHPLPLFSPLFLFSHVYLSFLFSFI